MLLTFYNRARHSTGMRELLSLLFCFFKATLSGQCNLALENLALRQQLAILKRTQKRPAIITKDRLFWVWLSRIWSEWRVPLLIVKPDTVIGWHRKGFRLLWTRLLAGMRIEEVMTAPHSPWQSPYVERLIGSIRRECLDHVIVLGENHLRRILRSYIAYYHRSRTHLSLCKDAPEPRAKQAPECGPVIEIAEVGGLHHRDERRAA
jgi:hypothetical protein